MVLLLTKNKRLAVEPDFNVFKKLSKEAQINWMVQHLNQDLYWVIRPIVKSHADTDDVLQNVWLKVYKNLDRFQYRSKLFSWLYRIAVNEAFNHVKKMTKHKNAEVENYMLQNLKDDNYYTGDDISLLLENAILQLPPKQQEVFRLKYFSEMTFEEMSELLGTSTGALKSSYHIAVKKIKTSLKQF